MDPVRHVLLDNINTGIFDTLIDLQLLCNRGYAFRLLLKTSVQRSKMGCHLIFGYPARIVLGDGKGE